VETSGIAPPSYAQAGGEPAAARPPADFSTDTIAAVGRPLLPVLLGAVLAIAGCGKEEAPVAPAECKSGPAALRSALAAAPGPVTVDGVRLSECVSRAGDAADIQAVGASLVAVAAGLAERAQADPNGREALELGYLIGATRRGASETQGIHDELVSRLEQEVLVVDTGAASFRRGERAGRQSG
jgi:hypothetical protein